MGIGSFLKGVGGAVVAPFKAISSVIMGWFYSEEKAIIEFFTPLLLQIKAEALIIGKDNLAAGLKVLQDSAMAAVIAAQNAPAGQKVAMAEAEFLAVAASEGITAIHNAEAAAIKAAVAILQAREAAANTAPPTTTP